MNRSLKICLINNTGRLIVRFRKELIIRFLKEGYRVYALFPFDGSEEQLTELGVTCVSIPIDSHSKNIIKELIAIFSICHQVARIKPDLIFSFTAKPVFYGSLAGRMLKVQAVSMITGLGRAFANNSRSMNLTSKILLKLYGFFLADNKKVIFQNDEDLDLFLENKLVKPRQVIKINGSGINLDEFKSKQRYAEKGNVEFLMVSRLFREKGVVEFCIASDRIISKYGVKCTLVGGIEENSKIQIDGMSLKKFLEHSKINYAGEKSSIQENLYAANIFVLPSHGGEGVPRAILEALATGLPVITTDTSGCRDTINNNGLLIEPRSADKLFEAMEWVIQNSDKMPIWSKQSRIIAETHFDVKKVVNTIMEEVLAPFP